MRLAPMLDDLSLDQPLPFRDPTEREVLDLNALLVPHPLATLYMRVVVTACAAMGRSMATCW